jgi:hypothetical protein
MSEPSKETTMTFANTFMSRLSDAADRFGAGVREVYAPASRAHFGYDRLREALTPAFDQFVAALSKSGQAVQSATTPYLECLSDNARSGAALVQDTTAASAKAMAEMLQRRRGLFARHPYLIAITIAGSGYVAIRQWRKHAAAKAAAARRKPARAKTARARPSRAAAAARNRSQRERRARDNSSGTNTAAAKVH